MEISFPEDLVVLEGVFFRDGMDLEPYPL
jgi:hypothetical protein